MQSLLPEKNISHQRTRKSKELSSDVIRIHIIFNLNILTTLETCRDKRIYWERGGGTIWTRDTWREKRRDGELEEEWIRNELGKSCSFVVTMVTSWSHFSVFSRVSRKSLKDWPAVQGSQMNSGRDPISLSFFLALTGSNQCEVLGLTYFFLF